MTHDPHSSALALSNSLKFPVGLLAPSASQFLHYTSLEAFYSIAETARIRFTSSKSSNDPSEFLIGRGIVDRALREILDELGSSEQKLIISGQSRLTQRQFRAFVFCMSEAAHDEAEVGELSQWRLYGSDGRGVAFVFDTRLDFRRQQLERLGSIPRRIIYGEDNGLHLVKSEIRSYLYDLRHLSNPTLEHLANPIIGTEHLCNRLVWLPSVIKHKAYEHEREVRLIQSDIGDYFGHPIVFHERNSIRRPTIELPIAECDETLRNGQKISPISRVIIGPSGDQAAIEDSICLFLEARNWQVEVVRSNIPYRAL